MPSFVAYLLLSIALAACAGAERPRAATPSASPRCGFVRMELDERSADEKSDSVWMMLVYTPPDAAPGAEPVSARVRVQRERVDDLQAELRSRPDLVCEPEAGAPGGFRALLP